MANAIEARRKAALHQFFKVMEEIEKAINNGETSTMLFHVHYCYPEVAKRLAKDGYDVKVVCREEEVFGYTEVFWSSAEEGRTGTANYISKTEGTEKVLSLDEMTDYDVALEAALKVNAEEEPEPEETLEAALKVNAEEEPEPEEALVAALNDSAEADMTEA